MLREYEFLADGVFSLWFERSKTPAWGLFGGNDATGPDVVINPGTPEEEHMLKVNAHRATKGTVIRLAVGGGGGYGDAALRDPEAVRHDIENGYLSRERAAADYSHVDLS